MGHKTMVNCLAGDNSMGNIVVTGSEDTKAKVWDIRMKSNNCIFTFSEHTGPVSCVQLSPDSKWVSSGGQDGALKIWEISNGNVLANFQMPG